MKLLISPAEGELVPLLARQAIDSGCAPRLARWPARFGGPPPGAEIVDADPSAPDGARRLLEGCGAAVHVLPQPRAGGGPSLETFREEAGRALSLFETALEADIGKHVLVSSVLALGSTGERPADENWRGEPADGLSHAFAAIDARVGEWAAGGNPIVTVYPAWLYGPGLDQNGGGANGWIRAFADRRFGALPETPDRRWTLAYAGDTAKGCLLAVERGRPGERYILGGQDATLNELLDLLESVTGVSRPKRGGAGRLWRALLSGPWRKRSAGADAWPAGRHHWRFSSQKAIGELGYIRTPLKIGVIKTLEEHGVRFADGAKTLL